MHNKYEGLCLLQTEVDKYLSDDTVETFLKLYLLLYADDTVIMAESPEQLQSALNIMSSNCETNGLVVNLILISDCLRA